MDTWVIVLIIIAAIVLVGIIVVGGRRARERQLDSKRSEAAHLRTEAYPVYRRHLFPPEGGKAAALSYAENEARIGAVKKTLA